MEFFSLDSLPDISVFLFKVLCGVALVFYFLVSVLIYRHVRLIGKAVTTRYAGLINCIGIIQILGVLVLLIILIFV